MKNMLFGLVCAYAPLGTLGVDGLLDRACRAIPAQWRWKWLAVVLASLAKGAVAVGALATVVLVYQTMNGGELVLARWWWPLWGVVALAFVFVDLAKPDHQRMMA